MKGGCWVIQSDFRILPDWPLPDGIVSEPGITLPGFKPPERLCALAADSIRAGIRPEMAWNGRQITDSR